MNAVTSSNLLATLPTGVSPFSSPDLIGRFLFFGLVAYLLTLLLYAAIRPKHVKRFATIVVAACIPVVVFSAYVIWVYLWNTATEARVRYITGNGFGDGHFAEILFWDRIALLCVLVYSSLAVIVLGGLLRRGDR